MNAPTVAGFRAPQGHCGRVSSMRHASLNEHRPLHETGNLGVSTVEASMRLTPNLAGKLILRTIGLCFLAVFLQWAGMVDPTKEGTLYAQIAHLVGAGSSGGSVAKLPPQQ